MKKLIILVAFTLVLFGCASTDQPAINHLVSQHKSASKCLTIDQQLYFDTSTRCDSKPSIDRVFGGQDVVTLAGDDSIAANIGNEIRLWSLNADGTPANYTESGFRIPNVGDSDYDLLNFSMCDGCRYGVANFKASMVLFDLGSGANFNVFRRYDDAILVPGAFTFKHNGQQYLIAAGLENECTSRASTVYKFDGIDDTSDLTRVTCAEGSENIVGGFKVGNYLYLGAKSQRIYIFEILDVGSSIELNYISQPMYANMAKGRGLAVDVVHGIAIQAIDSGMRVWDISDPAAPVRVATVAGSFNRAAIKYPIAFAARFGVPHSERTFDITIPSNPVPFEQDFWGSGNPWNYAGAECIAIHAAVFDADGTSMYVMRYSIMQRVMVPCVTPDGEIFIDGFESGDAKAWSFVSQP